MLQIRYICEDKSKGIKEYRLGFFRDDAMFRKCFEAWNNTANSSWVYSRFNSAKSKFVARKEYNVVEYGESYDAMCFDDLYNGGVARIKFI